MWVVTLRAGDSDGKVLFDKIIGSSLCLFTIYPGDYTVSLTLLHTKFTGNDKVLALKEFPV